MTTKRFYVYTLSNPDGSVFYVGKGQRGRMAQHERDAATDCDCSKCQHIRSIWATNDTVIRTVVFRDDSEDAVFAEERRLIASIGRNALLNKTNGGEGRSGLCKHPAGVTTVGKARYELKRKLRAALDSAPFSLRHRLKEEYQKLLADFDERVERTAADRGEYVEYLRDVEKARSDRKVH